MMDIHKFFCIFLAFMQIVFQSVFCSAHGAVQLLTN